MGCKNEYIFYFLKNGWLVFKNTAWKRLFGRKSWCASKNFFIHTIVCHIAGIDKHHNIFQSRQSSLNDFQKHSIAWFHQRVRDSAVLVSLSYFGARQQRY